MRYPSFNWIDFLVCITLLTTSFILRFYPGAINFKRRLISIESKGEISTFEKNDSSIPIINTVSPPSDDEGSETATDGEDDDTPPAFPSLTSAQRVKSLPKKPTDSQLMPPPPIPMRTLGVNQTLLRPAGATSTLRVLETRRKPPKPSRKVALAPGHSLMDWANLKRIGKVPRGVDTLLRVTPSLLKQHNKREDAWVAVHGKVYNITPYLAFHPGGEREIMRAAGRDGTKLFTLTHSWVSAEMMLDACLVGFLIPEPSS